MREYYIRITLLGLFAWIIAVALVNFEPEMFYPNRYESSLKLLAYWLPAIHAVVIPIDVMYQRWKVDKKKNLNNRQKK